MFEMMQVGDEDVDDECGFEIFVEFDEEGGEYGRIFFDGD